MRIIVIWLISKLSLHFVLEIYSVVIIQSFFSRSFVKALEFSSVRFCLEVKPRDIDYYRYRMNIHTISNKTLAEFIVAVRGVCRQKWNWFKYSGLLFCGYVGLLWNVKHASPKHSHLSRLGGFVANTLCVYFACDHVFHIWHEEKWSKTNTMSIVQ